MLIPTTADRSDGTYFGNVSLQGNIIRVNPFTGVITIAGSAEPCDDNFLNSFPSLAIHHLAAGTSLAGGGYDQPIICTDDPSRVAQALPKEEPDADPADNLTALSQLSAPVISVDMTDDLVVDIDNDNMADPGDTLGYTVVINNSGDTGATNTLFTDTIDPNTTFVVSTVSVTPIAQDDTFDVIGNVGIFVPDGLSDLLANDLDPDNGSVTANPVSDAATANGGSITINADGSFSYEPPPGFVGIDTFTYTITDDEGDSDTADVILGMVDSIWFIDNSTALPGDGSLNSPFNTLAAFEAVNGGLGPNDPRAGDCIFIHSGSGDYTGGVTLEDDQTLLGQGATGNIVDLCEIPPTPFSFVLPNAGGISILTDDPATPALQDPTCTPLDNVGKITIVKDANPADGTDFPFTSDIPANPSFTLDDEVVQTDSFTDTIMFLDLTPGLFVITENVPTAWDLDGIDCSNTNDPNDTSLVDLVNNQVTIDLDVNEEITCIFHNSLSVGTIIIVKNTIPNGPQDFDYTTTGGLTPSTFSLDDDANPTLSNIQTFNNVLAGTYTVTERPLLDFMLRSVECIDPDNGSFRQGLAAVIDLDPGETVTCTFTNASDIVKTVHSEKEILVDLTLGRIKEVTIYAEIHENLNRLRADQDPIVLKQIEGVTCEKLINNGKVLNCETSTPPEDDALITGVQNCLKQTVQFTPNRFTPQMNTVSKSSSSDSGGMNTVISGLRPAIVKTIDAQKEVFLCEQGTKIKDVVIFTEIFENLNLLPDKPILFKQYEVLTCLKDATTLIVESCVFSPTQRIFP